MANEKLKQEAIKRLEYLTEQGLHPDVLKAFKKNETIYYSDRTPLGGMLCWCNDAGSCPKEVQDKIKFLNDKGYLVYHATHEKLPFGECWDLFILTEEDVDESMCEEMFDEFKSGIQLAFVMNMDDSNCSEYGSIGYEVHKASGGIIRNA